MRTFRSLLAWSAALAGLLVALPGRGALGLERDEVLARYTKYEFQVPVRDGAKLFTAVYAPKDRSRTYPILLTRTPYSVGPYGVDRYRSDLGPSDQFGKAGYIFVYQDVRGRWMSEGEFDNMRPMVAHGTADTRAIDESTDTWDTIEWLVKHLNNHNGKVGMWGISYPGFYTDCGLVGAHPALKAASPQAPVTDWFIGDDWHHNGALFLPHAFNFMAKFGHPRPRPTKKFDFPFDHGTPDGYDFFLKLGPLSNADTQYFHGDVAFWNDIMKHGTYDAFWKARNVRQHLKDVRPAVMTVGGWFDAENLFGALETYRAIEASSPQANNVLVMGPWVHGGWGRGGQGDSLGPVRFHSKTSLHYAEKIEFPFFERHLKGVGSGRTPEATVFNTGRNEWREHASWPPSEARRRSLYLHAEGKLSFDPPTGSSSRSDGSGTDSYVSDPARPVPYINEITNAMSKQYMVADQRFAARRTDVLTYQTEVLDEDITLAGPIVANLVVSTSGTDSDWVVKVVDVYPDDFPDSSSNPGGERMGGYQQLVRGDVMRGKFRNSFERPEPFVPGSPTPVNFTLQDVYHTFRPGHRIMVQIQSTWFPLVDRNPQKFVDIYAASPDDFQKATQAVYRSAEQASRLQVNVLP